MYYISKQGLNTCKKQMGFFLTKIRTEIDEMATSVQWSYLLQLLLVPSPIHVATHPISRVHASNITCQKLL